MQTVGIRELKAKLSEYLRRVQEGEAIAITDRGKTIAHIGPELLYPSLATSDGAGMVRDPGVTDIDTLRRPRHPQSGAQKSYAALLKETQKAWGYSTPEETLSKALEEHLRRKKQLSILDLAGTIDFHPGYNPKDGRKKR